MELSEHKIYVDAWRYEAVMLFDTPDDTSHYADMLTEAHDVIAQLDEENRGLREALLDIFKSRKPGAIKLSTYALYESVYADALKEGADAQS